MKILFLCTAHNSLSQRLYLELMAAGHDISIEYALSDKVMLEAVELFQPNIIICPFLTARVPAKIYNYYCTLIVHPGVPGDAGPSAIDWVLMGDDGTIDDANELLGEMDKGVLRAGRSHWGITVLQAVEQLDAGPVWAWEQFPIDVDEQGLTKSSLYRGPVTRAAVKAVPVAISRIVKAIDQACDKPSDSLGLPAFYADPKFAQLSVTDGIVFQGGKTHHRPLLKAAQRVFHPSRHSAAQVSRRIRSADSQPGVLTKIFGPPLYVYGGQVEQGKRDLMHLQLKDIKILGMRNEAVCIGAADGKGVWITHVRRPKVGGGALWPKVPAATCLLEGGVLTTSDMLALDWPASINWAPSPHPSLQDIYVKIEVDSIRNKVAYLYFDFYNGATSTSQCPRLIEAMDYIISQSRPEDPIRAVALMGSSSYFSNGIALNVIEAAEDPSMESWNNINRIDDVVHHLLHKFPSKGILTIAAVRGNAAAGGVALAAACDLVIAGSEVVLNPAYRAIGLYGSEYHQISYFGRCGEKKATDILRAMTPMGPLEAQRARLVDYVFPGHGKQLDEYIHSHISLLLQPACIQRGFWKAKIDLSASALALVRTKELGEMAKDFWSPRAARYHSRRFDFVRKVKPTSTPFRLAKHRRRATDQLDEEEKDVFDDVEVYRKRQEDVIKEHVRKEIRSAESSTTFTTPTTSSSSSSDDINGFVDKLERTRLDDGEDKKEAAAKTLFQCYYQPGQA